MLRAVVPAALSGRAARTPLDLARQAWLKEALAQVEPANATEVYCVPWSE